MIPMHSEFGTWYRLAEPNPTSERLTGRWSVVEKIAEDTGHFPDALLLSIAYGFRLGTFDTAGYSGFCGVFQEADASFDMRGVVEHAILATAAIVCRMGKADDDASSRSALAVVCSSCAGLRSSEIPQRLNLLSAARHALRALAANRWQDGDNSPRQLKLDVNLDELHKQAGQDPAQPQVAQGIVASLQAIKKHLDWTAEDLRRRTRREVLLSEECNMLWWLTGGHSVDRDMPYGRMKVGEAALVAGKELADLTRLPPGPVSVPAFFRRLLLTIKGASKSAPLAQAVDACKVEWRQGLVDAGNSKHAGFVVPLHIAIEESVKSPTWGDAFRTRTDLSSTDAVAPCDLASQFYLERLFLKMRASND
jgi:hypothetical protein